MTLYPPGKQWGVACEPGCDMCERAVREQKQQLATPAAAGNRKTTEGKTPYEALPLPELAGVAKVFAYGNAKYGDKNWRLPLPNTDDTISKYYAACLRHLAACWDEAGTRDAESGLLHIDHAIASLLIARSQMDGI